MTNELAVNENESMFIIKAREQMEIAKRIIVNGKKLSDDEVRALAVYTVQTGLNISLNECYYMPGTGPIPGIAGIRRLAKESAIQEANSAKYRLVGKGYRLDFVLLKEETNEANFNVKDGDIAYKCILTSDMDEAFWLNKLFPVIEKFLSYGLDYKSAKQQAIELIGDCPRTEYVAVVYGSESFSYNGKPEKMDRHERAKKRAEKGALKKRFALKINTDFEEPEEFVQMDIINNNQLLLEDKQEYENNLKDKTINELTSMLGFDEEPNTSNPEKPDISLVEAAQELGGVVKEEASQKIYSGKTVKIHTHEYPQAWGKVVSAFVPNKIENVPHLDGILQKLELTFDTPVDDVIASVNDYLKNKQEKS